MRAVVHHAYGPPERVLSLHDIERPAVGPTEVLVRVRATSVHPDIWHVVTGTPFVLRLMGNGVSRPRLRVPGSDLAGIVEEVGARVTRFTPGDEVFGESTSFAWKNGGAFAEYAAVQEDLLALKPATVTFEQAATVPTSGYIALANLRGMGPLAGRHVLINGAAGCLGSLAIQMAKAAGARVTAVDRADTLDMMRALGADDVIDYRVRNVLDGPERYDAVLDVASTLWFDVCAPILAPGGQYVPIGHAHFGRATGRMGGRVVGSLPAFVGLMVRGMMDAEKRKGFSMLGKPEAMAALARLLESGQLTPVVAHRLPLEGVVEAMTWLAEERAVGKIVLAP